MQAEERRQYTTDVLDSLILNSILALLRIPTVPFEFLREIKIFVRHKLDYSRVSRTEYTLRFHKPFGLDRSP
jgi:hypothetical protein